MVLDSQRWKWVEAIPPLLFSVDGPSTVRGRESGRSGWLTMAEGRIEDVSDHHVTLDDGVTLAYVVPPRIGLRALLGACVKLTLNDEPAAAGPRAQMLTIADEAGAPLLLARFGPAGQTHAIGKSRLRTTLSQRPNGPMAFGTEKLQYMVQVGEHVRVRDRMHELGGELVVHFVARTAFDYVAYVIVDQALWLRRPSWGVGL